MQKQQQLVNYGAETQQTKEQLEEAEKPKQTGGQNKAAAEQKEGGDASLQAASWNSPWPAAWSETSAQTCEASAPPGGLTVGGVAAKLSISSCVSQTFPVD